MPAPEGRILRGDHWGERLRRELALAPVDPRAWMEQHTQVLKSDSHSQVGLLRLDDQLCYLKFYQHKSLPQKLLFHCGRGRGVQAYDAAARLTAAGIPVPQARACVLVPQGMLLLTQGLAESRDLKSLLLERPDGDHSGSLLRSAGAGLADLHRAGFTHGDCKWSNLLWSEQRMYLVDLEAVSETGKRRGEVKRARDLARFTVNAEDMGLEPELYDAFLDSYLQGVTDSREELLTRVLPPLRQLRIRHRAKYGERGERLL